jgi:hypothetical protein
MKSLFNYEPAIPQRYEIVILRVVLALLIWEQQSMWTQALWDPIATLKAIVLNPFTINFAETTQPEPNGLAAWFDLTWLTHDPIERTLRALSAMSLLAFMAGLRPAISLLVPMMFGIGYAALRNSQGAIGHSAQPVYLVALAVWATSVWSTWQARRGHRLPDGLSAGALEWRFAQQAFVATYVVSALTKLYTSGLGWITTTRYLPLHIVKGSQMEYHDTLNAAALQHSWLPQVMMEHPLLCSLIFGVALPMELGAFLMLRNRRLAAILGMGLLMFHGVVTELMSLSFIFNKAFLITLFITPWWWVQCDKK